MRSQLITVTLDRAGGGMWGWGWRSVKSNPDVNMTAPQMIDIQGSLYSLWCLTHTSVWGNKHIPYVEIFMWAKQMIEYYDMHG